MHCLLPLCKLPTIFCWKHVWINFTISRTGDGATNSLPIKPRDGGQVESHPSVILSGKQHGSGPITSQNQPEGNPSPNITTFCDQVVAPPWPKGYGPSICFALSLFCRMVKFLWLQIQNNYGDNWIALCCLGAEIQPIISLGRVHTFTRANIWNLQIHIVQFRHPCELIYKKLQPRILTRLLDSG